MDKNILFFTPFIEEHRSEDEKCPAHELMQRVVNTLRNSGLSVITTSDEGAFLRYFSDSDLVIVFSFDGHWMIESVEKASHTVQVLYFYCLSEPNIGQITPCYIGKELEDINLDKMLAAVLASLSR